MSFTTGTLLLQESSKLAGLYRELGSWDAVRVLVDSENILQTRTVKSSKSLSKVIISRLKGLAPEELQLLVEGSPQEQRYLLWIAVCRRHRFIAEFATEILRERYICLKTQLPYDEFDTFFNGKAAWHPALEGLRPSTRGKLRQVLFKMMREADLLTDDFTIKGAMITPDLVKAIPATNRNDLLCLPVYENDLRRILNEFGH
jgi:hypothetical protein